MTSILWQRLDGPGHDRATIGLDAGGYRIAGTALLADESGSFDIRYSVLVDAGWETRVVAAHLQGPDGDRRLSIAADEDGRWKMGETTLDDLQGATDVDFAFTPATNTLPIRRLGLAVGDSAEITVAHVAFPERTMALAQQRYERLSEDTYRFSSGELSTDLTVNEAGLVTRYPDLWQAV